MDLSASARDDRAGKKGPGRGWYAAAVLPVICGFAAMGVVLFTQLPKLDDGLEQIVVPGARELTLEPGRHTVFLEYRSVVDGRVYAVDQVAGLTVRVEAADGAPVAVSAPMGSSTYSMGGRQGEAINVFSVERAGAYRISADYDGQEGPQTVIAVGQGFMGQLFATVFMGLGAVFLGMALTVAAVIGVYLARRRARRA
ncbi:hypothetical protein [Brevundimonas diminuta]|uniref:hypothetical protein n=1 Tax=Brevundimonas diminuta TaxID=293 RepID=UPI001178444F|nr:hypothetical protein [Brevundimonas diminuta]